MQVLRATIGLFLFFMLACTGFAPPTEPQPTPALPTPATTAGTASTTPTPVTPPAPNPSTLTAAELAEFEPPPALPAYTADCRATLSYTDELTNERKTRCDLPFTQSCGPDQGGCWARQDACQNACATPCKSCQDECAGPCDTCAAACAPGDTACRTACAVARTECGERCMASRQTCIDACAAVASTCEGAFAEKRDRLCPNCTEIGNCQWKEPRCTAKDFPNDAAECMEWCYVE